MNKLWPIIDLTGTLKLGHHKIGKGIAQYLRPVTKYDQNFPLSLVSITGQHEITWDNFSGITWDSFMR